MSLAFVLHQHHHSCLPNPSCVRVSLRSMCFPGTVSLLSWQRAPYARHRSWLNSRVPFYREFWLPPPMYCWGFHVSSFFGLRFIIEGCDEFKHAASAWHLLPCTTMCFRLLHKSVNLTRIDPPNADFMLVAFHALTWGHRPPGRNVFLSLHACSICKPNCLPHPRSIKRV